jgi:aspartate aminotransferase-like enzyme
MINHRGPEFASLIHRTTEKLKQIYLTENDVLTLTASGTGAMEAAVVNFMPPGSHALVITIGVFGNRFKELVNAYGGIATVLEFSFGSAADLEQIKDALEKNPEIKTVFVTHNETSTGVTNPIIPDLAQVVQQHDALLIVDAISSLSSVEFRTDDWGVDVVCSGSQKGWMTAPGLSFISVSEKAWKRFEENPQPRFYFDLLRHQKALADGQTPWTPAISVWFSLDKALDMMIEEGLEAIWTRHARAGQRVRDGVRAMGLKLFSEEGVESNTVTSIAVPTGLDGLEMLKIARERYSTVFAGGQAGLKGQIVRFGHLGYMPDSDLDFALDALRNTLVDLNFKA